MSLEELKRVFDLDPSEDDDYEEDDYHEDDDDNKDNEDWLLWLSS